MAMSPSSFIIEFAEHISTEKRRYCLGHLVDLGAEVQDLGERRFEIVCYKPLQLAKVGRSLFQTHFAQLCKVVTTTGHAEARADAYRKPPVRD